MPSTGRRSQELQKKLQRRNNSLTPANFTKDQTLVSHVETKKDPVEKSKAALSDLRRRIDERKRSSKLIDIQQYQERREETIPELTGVTFSESPISERQEPSPKDETLAQTIMSSTPKYAPTRRNVEMKNTTLEKMPSRSIKNHYRDDDRYRNDISKEERLVSFDKAPPSQIEVRSNDTPDNDDDDNSEVSEITTDVRIMSTKGASYAERRMAGNVQMRLARPSLLAPADRHLERDVNINVSNLRHLGKAVEQAKLDLRKEMSPTNATPRRHGLPYEATDYRPSVDEDEVDSWGDAIRTEVLERRHKINSPTQKEEQNEQFIADKTAAKKLQKLVKEAYSYEGDVFIDATEIREEDLDGAEFVLSDEGGNHSTPIKLDDTTVDTSVLLGDEILHSEVEEKMTTTRHSKERKSFVQESREEANIDDLSPKRNESNWPDVSFEDDIITDQKNNGIDHENIESDDQTLKDLENNPPSFTNDPASMASDFYNSSLGFFKSFSNQADAQLKAFQHRGLISKSDMDGMLGVLEHDVKETKTKLPKDRDDVIIFLGDEFEATAACGSDLQAVKENTKESTGGCNPDPVEKMLESLKKSYNTGISKCGIDSDLIKENTKAIEKMVANLKNTKSGDQNNATGVAASKAQSEPLPEGKIDGNLLKELSAQRVEDMIKKTIPLTTTQGVNKTFVVSVNMPKNE